MDDVAAIPNKRKILSLKLEKHQGQEARFVVPEKSVYMVWCEGGDMPRRVYRSSEKSKAANHAKKLAEQENRRFYVMRSWRGYEPQ